jgi:hypothetical protein
MIGLQALGYLGLARFVWTSDPGPAAQRRKRVIAVSLPFLIPLALFLVYRLFFFEAGRGAVNVGNVLAAYQASPLGELGRRLIELGKDFVEAVVFGWAVPTYNLTFAASPTVILTGMAFGLVAALAYRAFARWSDRNDDQPASVAPPDRRYREFVLIGAFTVVVATVPVILAGRDIRWASAFDRYTLHATLGIGLLVTGLIFTWLRPPARTWAVGLLLGLSVLTHQANASAWATFWSEQRSLWWQLSWRAPGLKPGTLLLVTLPSQRFFEDYEVWGPANLIYAPGRENPQIASEVVEELTAVKARQGVREVRSMRVLISIPRDYSKLLMASWPRAAACVHVLDRDQLEASPADSSLALSLGASSDIDRIETGAAPAVLPERIFGPEPEHGWCWFYQTASLARQQRDWDRVVELADQAHQLNLSPQDPTEWMPFFQGYVNRGRWEEARRIAIELRQDPLAARTLCGALSGGTFTDPAAEAFGRGLLCDVETE